MAPAVPFLAYIKSRRQYVHSVRTLLDKIGVTIVANHYYEPVYVSSDIRADPSIPRALAGIDWNIDKQLALLNSFDYADALGGLEGRSIAGKTFTYANDTFGPGDGEALYAMVRRFLPKRVIEIGCGASTLIIEFALMDARKQDPTYRSEHICFEPFENPWLESLGIDVRRDRIENVDVSLFRQLSAEDIVFVDSSHVLRPMGDV
jgi:hypothetical protein